MEYCVGSSESTYKKFEKSEKQKSKVLTFRNVAVACHILHVYVIRLFRLKLKLSYVLCDMCYLSSVTCHVMSCVLLCAMRCVTCCVMRHAWCTLPYICVMYVTYYEYMLYVI